VSEPSRTEGGEKPGARDQMDRFTRHLVNHGTPADKAQAMARTEARKADDARGVRRK